MAFWVFESNNVKTEISQNQEESISDNETPSSGESDPCLTETVPLSASRRKLAQDEVEDTPNEIEDANLELPEYRFVDIQRLSSTGRQMYLFIITFQYLNENFSQN